MLKPIGNRVIIERLEEEPKTKSGIIIPDNAKEKPLKGKIVNISKEVEYDENIPIKIGDIVIFAKYSGNEINYEDKEYIILNTDDILAKITS